MTNSELISELAQREGFTKAQAKQAIKGLVSIIRGEVQAEGRLALADLGVFTLRDRKARKVGKHDVAAHKGVHFRAAANFKRAVNLK